MKGRISIAAVIVMLIFNTSLHADNSVMVHDAWTKEAPPGMTVMSAYMTIENRSAEKRVLLKVSSPQFARIEMHRSVIENEKARMIPQASIAIASGGSLSMAPGGYHLMLFEPAKELRKGDRVSLELTFANGEIAAVDAPVVRMEHAGDMHQHQHN